MVNSSCSLKGRNSLILKSNTRRLFSVF